MMKLRRSRRGRRVKAEMNVVPYIDVMLVLLVIFMIAAPLINETVEVQLPVAPGEPFKMPEDITDGRQPMVISINSDGLYSSNYSDEDSEIFNNVVIQAVALRADIPNLPIIVRGDKNIAYGKLLDMVLELRKSGIDAVGIATSPDGDEQ